ncbi:damage-control phosphatase ARMT1 family protein, partial [Candidatus Electronema sp. TJ]|uniref:damage-control phosphatase ARMT1 family protein n=1 Tax=Candidatus Electronema sp. TJ TaxID=3401573 RepID=UPI003AA7CAAF
ADTAAQRLLCDEAGRFIAAVDTDLSPPENAIALYSAFGRILGSDDPFARVKRESNELTLSLREEIRRKIEAADDPLRAAVRAAIGGNIIDYAAQHTFDAAQTMQDCFVRDFVVDDYPALRAAVSNGRRVLYLCDNCGEIVFDCLLIDQLLRLGCQVTAAVRGGPIINDATLDDARLCGMDQLCPVISSGVVCPGTPLALCSEEFRTQFNAADVIISKGMGNFETLSETVAPIYFLFTVKCAEVANHLTRRLGLAPSSLSGGGEMVLLRQQRGSAA